MKLLTPEQEQRIESIIHSRFYNRVSVYDVFRWLSNFEDNETDYAIEILSHVSYYRESDLVDMLKKSLEVIVEGICNGKFYLYFMGIGKPGKSGDMMMYLVQKIITSSKGKYANFYKFIRNSSDIKLNQHTDRTSIIILLDDIIGSGGSFSKFIDYNNKLDGGFLKEIIDKGKVLTFLLAAVILDKGKDAINKNFPHVKLLGETYSKAFEKGRSIIGGYSSIVRLREFCFKYGILLTKDKNKALGWNNAQALVVFDHATPNNSLPILWSSNYVAELDRNWVPLFPRFYDEVSSRSFRERTDNNRWMSLLAKQMGVKRTKLRDYFTSENYNLIMILRMLMTHEPDFRIANTLGLTYNDLEQLYKVGEGRLWDKKHVVTETAKRAYDEVEKLRDIERTNNKWCKPTQVSDIDNMYIPETFRGLK